jgi:hypothetical protein
MALPAFVSKLVSDIRTESKKAHRSARGEYVELHRRLGAGEEICADETKRIFESVQKSDSDFERDAEKQQERLRWHAQRVLNQQAIGDRLQAERELQTAQVALQEAFDKLQPAVDAAYAKLSAANHGYSITTQAENWLADPMNILNIELLERESAVAKDLRAISQELKPLESDRTRKQTYLSNLESQLDDLQSSAAGPWLQHVVAPWLGRVNADIRVIESRISDVRNELRQLDSAIRQRQSTQARLQSELNEIHRLKLEP